MDVKINLKDGLYKIWNGNDCDNISYYAYLVLIEGQIFHTEFTTNSFVFDFVQLNLEEGVDLFQKLGVKDYQKIS